MEEVENEYNEFEEKDAKVEEEVKQHVSAKVVEPVQEEKKETIKSEKK